MGNLLQIANNQDSRLDFENFQKKDKQNRKKFKKFLKYVNNDVDDILKYHFAKLYSKDINKESNDYERQLIEFTGSKNFASGLTYLQEAQKWYALYYMHTDEGKNIDNRLTILEGLIFINDLIIYSTLKHFNGVKHKPLIWKEDDFFSTEDFDEQPVVSHIYSNLQNLFELITAVDKADNLAVYTAYTHICENENTPNKLLEPFPEFS